MRFGSVPPSIPTSTDFLPETIRGTTGFCRVGRTRGGQWWLIDPHDRGFLAKAVSGVHPLGRRAALRPGAGNDDHFDATRSFLPPTVHRLRSWNFNTLGIRSHDAAASGMYFSEILDFKEVGPLLHLGDLYLPDVFDPAWALAVERRAEERCAGRVADRALLGYFTDEALNWAQGVGGEFERPSLLQLCLSLEPSSRAYHAAWEYVLAPRRGELERLGDDWGITLPHREIIRQLTLADSALRNPSYCHDHYEFSREFARRYFAITARAIRHSDPHHLLFGPRWEVPPGPAILSEATFPHVDICAAALLQPGGTPWGDWDFGPQPVWCCDVGRQHGADDAAIEGLGTDLPLPSQTFRQLAECLSHPAVVGYEWESWRARHVDTPASLSALIDHDLLRPREHVLVLSAINGEGEALHLGAAFDGPPSLHG